ncbi:hypothetical protein HD554DRAFT_2041017 [Boletus coccyginus]|nr:hypothetical protein HD554DRAFT_2041017 [Boletus coccyginus]
MPLRTCGFQTQKYEDLKECKAYVEFALGPSLPFMYGKIKYIGAEHYKTFASHLRDVAIMDNNTYHKLIDNAMPRDALVLAVTSVERTLTIYSTGVKEMSGKSEGKFGQILDGAQKCCNAAVQSRQVQVSQHILTTDMLDDCALIAVSSDIEVESDGEV